MNQTMTGMDFKIREVANRVRELREISGFTVEEMAVQTLKMSGCMIQGLIYFKIVLVNN